MAVKEKLLQEGGLWPVVEGEDHLPVGSNTCSVSFSVLLSVTCSIKKRLTCILILSKWIIGVLNSNSVLYVISLHYVKSQ